MSYVENIRKLVGNTTLILVGSVVVILDKEDRVLLQKRNDHTKKYGLPGGLMELGESTEKTAIREVKEETGLDVQSLNLINVFSGEDYYMELPNGDKFYCVTIGYYTTDYSGTIEMDTVEGLALEFFHIDNLPENIIGSHREVLKTFIKEKYGNY